MSRTWADIERALPIQTAISFASKATITIVAGYRESFGQTASSPAAYPADDRIPSPVMIDRRAERAAMTHIECCSGAMR
jgi:hypothetical protein